jgi:hypothetical protein
MLAREEENAWNIFMEAKIVINRLEEEVAAR